MNRRELIAGAATLPLVACGGPQPVPAAPSYYIAGDSIGVGLGGAAGPGVTCVAEVGVTAHDLRRLDHQALLLPYDATVVLSLGTNDAARYRTTIDARPVLDLFGHCKRVLWVGPPATDKPWGAYAAMIDFDLAHELPEDDYISILGLSADLPATDRAPDGIHFTPRGYRRLWSAIVLGRYE